MFIVSDANIKNKYKNTKFLTFFNMSNSLDNIFDNIEDNETLDLQDETRQHRIELTFSMDSTFEMDRIYKHMSKMFMIIDNSIFDNPIINFSKLRGVFKKTETNVTVHPEMSYALMEYAFEPFLNNGLRRFIMSIDFDVDSSNVSFSNFVIILFKIIEEVSYGFTDNVFAKSDLNATRKRLSYVNNIKVDTMDYRMDMETGERIYGMISNLNHMYKSLTG